MKFLKGKRCLLTGAASGIGRALAMQLAREGVHLYLLDVDTASLQEVIDQCRQLGVVTVGRRCDLSQAAEISAAIADLLARWEYIDLLVNNAGVAYYGPTENMTGTVELADGHQSARSAANYARAAADSVETRPARTGPHPQCVQHFGHRGGWEVFGLSHEQIWLGRLHGSVASGIQP